MKKHGKNAVPALAVILPCLLAALLCACAAQSPQPPQQTAADKTVQTPAQTPAPTAAPTVTPGPTPFSIAWMSDTQNYVSSYPDVLTSMMQYVAHQQKEQNIVALLHTGDLLGGGYNVVQQDRLKAAAALLPKDLLCVTAGGNHDRAPQPHFYEYYLQYRFDTDYRAENALAPGACYHTTFTAGGTDFLVLSVSYLEERACLEWARGVLDAHPNAYVILLTHSYLDPWDNIRRDYLTSSGVTLYEGLVKPSANIRLVLSGHMRGAAYRSSATDEGHTVHELMYNAQENELGGGGYLRILTFDPLLDTIEVVTYSPYLDAYGMPDDPFGARHTLENAGLAKPS